MNRRRFLIASGAAIASPVRMVPLDGARGSPSESAPIVGGTLGRLTEPGASDNRATYLPDGNSLLFASKRSGRSQIWAMELDGGRVHQVHESAANDYGRVASNLDGTRLCFSSDRSGQNAVYVLDLNSGRVTLVSDPKFWSFGPTWSSRDLIAFFSKNGGNTINTWTVRPDGSEPRQITDRPGESRQPWWSPDGDTLALSADNGDGAFQVWLMMLDGTRARPITAGGSYQQPFWSPDGRQIAVSAKRGEPHFRIYVMNSATGGDLRTIGQPEGVDNVHPAWSPDGRSIVFTSGRGETRALVFHLGLTFPFQIVLTMGMSHL
jgi:TolB protein